MSDAQRERVMELAIGMRAMAEQIIELCAGVAQAEAQPERRKVRRIFGESDPPTSQPANQP